MRYQKTAQAHHFPEGQNTPDRYIVGAAYALVEVCVTCMLVIWAGIGKPESGKRETEANAYELVLLDFISARLKTETLIDHG